MSKEKDHPNIQNVDKFRNRLDNLIQVVRDAEELSYTEVVGVLQITMLDLFMETARDDIINQIRDEYGG